MGVPKDIREVIDLTAEAIRSGVSADLAKLELVITKDRNEDRERISHLEFTVETHGDKITSVENRCASVQEEKKRSKRSPISTPPKLHKPFISVRDRAVRASAVGAGIGTAIYTVLSLAGVI